MNWDIEPDGDIESEEYGWIVHTCRDTISFTSEDKLEKTAGVVATLLFQISKTKLPESRRTRSSRAVSTSASRIVTPVPNSITP